MHCAIAPVLPVHHVLHPKAQKIIVALTSSVQGRVGRSVVFFFFFFFRMFIKLLLSLQIKAFDTFC